MRRSARNQECRRGWAARAKKFRSRPNKRGSCSMVSSSAEMRGFRSVRGTRANQKIAKGGTGEALLATESPVAGQPPNAECVCRLAARVVRPPSYAQAPRIGSCAPGSGIRPGIARRPAHQCTRPTHRADAIPAADYHDHTQAGAGGFRSPRRSRRRGNDLPRYRGCDVGLNQLAREVASARRTDSTPQRSRTDFPAHRRHAPTAQRVQLPRPG